MDGQCFLRSQPSPEMIELYSDECNINLDSALNELGMLSTITNSRIDYLREQELGCLKEKTQPKAQLNQTQQKARRLNQKRNENSFSGAPLCVVHMNSDFVTEFSLSKNPTPIAECKLLEEPLKTKVYVNKMLNKPKRNLYAPYYLNRRVIPPEKLLEEEIFDIKADILAEDLRASPPIISRQDSGNKSNPSSPVKSQNSLTSVGCSIFRSRSLDDLEISKLNLNEKCDMASHGEIDTMSQRISKLHVS